MRKILFLALVTTASAWAQPAPTPDVMCRIIQDDIRRYVAERGPCSCPYSLLATGYPCADWSAWSKPAGQAPRCYFEDVTGELQPVRRGQPTRHTWPDPPPCILPMS